MLIRCLRNLCWNKPRFECRLAKTCVGVLGLFCTKVQNCWRTHSLRHACRSASGSWASSEHFWWPKRHPGSSVSLAAYWCLRLQIQPFLSPTRLGLPQQNVDLWAFCNTINICRTWSQAIVNWSPMKGKKVSFTEVAKNIMFWNFSCELPWPCWSQGSWKDEISKCRLWINLWTVRKAHIGLPSLHQKGCITKMAPLQVRTKDVLRIWICACEVHRLCNPLWKQCAAGANASKTFSVSNDLEVYAPKVFRGPGFCFGLAHCHPSEPGAICARFRWLPHLPWDSKDPGKTNRSEIFRPVNSLLNLISSTSLFFSRRTRKKSFRRSWTCWHRTGCGSECKSNMRLSFVFSKYWICLYKGDWCSSSSWFEPKPPACSGNCSVWWHLLPSGGGWNAIGKQQDKC